MIMSFSQVVLVVKKPACQCRRCKRCRFDPRVRKIPWRRKWQPTPVFLAGKFHGQRGLVGYSPWDLNKSDMTEWLCTTTHNIPVLKVNALATQQELLQFLLHIWNYYLEQSEAQVFPSSLISLWWIPVSSRVLLLHKLKGWLLLEVGRDPSSWYWRA